MTNNDLQITEYERLAKNKMRELSDAIRDEGLWVVIKKAKECEAALIELRLRAIKLGFEKFPKAS